MSRRWRIASEDEILKGRTTDVYFDRTLEVLRAAGKNPKVHAEVTVSGLPSGLDWGVLAGVDDALKLFEGRNVDVYGLSEGTLFYPRSPRGVKTPVIVIEGPYQEFTVLETPLLGFLCHTSGMVSRTARIRLAAKDKTLMSFGARRTHPAITPQVEYAAYIGGCDGVSSVLGAELLEVPASGTMPHALVIALQDQVEAWKAFDRVVPKGVPRIALTDTYLDEVRESVMAAESIQNLTGVRLDTTSSRRGNFKEIIQEVRWELDIRGFRNVKIFVSGNLDATAVEDLGDSGADGFGVGGAISNAPSVDFAMDIVSIEEGGLWKPSAKRGKFSGKKMVWRCEDCLSIDVTLSGAQAPSCPQCKRRMSPLTHKLMENGHLLQLPKSPNELRAKVIDQLRRLQGYDRTKERK